MVNAYVYCPTSDPNYPTCINAQGGNTDRCIADTPIAVSTFDQIYAWVFIDSLNSPANCGPRNCYWIVQWWDENTGESSAIDVQSPDEYTAAYPAALEAYNAPHCADFPSESPNGVTGGGIIDMFETTLYEPGSPTGGPDPFSFVAASQADFGNAMAVNPMYELRVANSCGYSGWTGGPGNVTDDPDLEIYWNASAGN
jgi:hypothetical protein